MTYQLNVCTDEMWSVWDNFCSHLDRVHDAADASDDNRDGATIFNAELAKFHAIDISGTQFIEFPTEEDALMFVLRFS